MLKYLIIPLTDDAVSFCHYPRLKNSGNPISIENLRKAIFWSMTENLNVQFLYPDDILPDEYHKLIDTVDHTSIASIDCKDKSVVENADFIVSDSWDSLSVFPIESGRNYVIRTTKDELFGNADKLKSILSENDSVAVVITDIDCFGQDDFTTYHNVLDSLVPFVANEIKRGRNLHFNLLTSRLLLDSMNNCGAGDESITLAPDGNFYICPAFYDKTGKNAIGNLDKGPEIRNGQLFKLEYAPICRICDAYHCRRCVWLNQKMTLEVNTPSHEQCVVSHIERNASQKLLKELQSVKGLENLKHIQDIDYLDPFELLEIPRASK